MLNIHHDDIDQGACTGLTESAPKARRRVDVKYLVKRPFRTVYLIRVPITVSVLSNNNSQYDSIRRVPENGLPLQPCPTSGEQERHANRQEYVPYHSTAKRHIH
jgi:hypothetical protein